MSLKVLYEDNHIIVVVKPFNVLSQGDATGDISIIDMVKDYIKKKYNKPGNVYLGLVHRLDRPVGGIMVFARSSKAASRLTKAFSEHQITKKYLAIVHGKLTGSGEFKDYIEKGKDGNSFVNKNGRHHQIRVQFASRGHYLLGDQRYGVLDNTQICLFSYYLSFTHPVTKEVLEFKYYPEKKGYWTIFTL